MDSIVTITAPPASIDLTVLETVREELKIADRKSDRLLRRYIGEESETITGYLERPLAETSLTQTFRILREDRAMRRERAALNLMYYPVSAIAEILLPDGAVATADDYELDKRSGRLWRLRFGRRAGWEPGAIAVAYTGGYALIGGLERTIEKACIQLVKLRWQSRDRDPTVRRLEVPGIEITEYWVGQIGENGALPPSVCDLLKPYRETAR